MKVIAIGGCSGAGKTYLAGALGRWLGACSTIALDSYYLPQQELTLEQRAVRNYDHPDALEWGLLEQHVRALLRGEAVDTPVYLFDQHTRAAETVRVSPGPVLLIEGILALHRAEIFELADVRVYVHAEAASCMKRRMDRDIAERGRSKESVVEQYTTTVWPMAQEFVLPGRRYADVVVDGEASVLDAVREIEARLDLA